MKTAPRPPPPSTAKNPRARPFTTWDQIRACARDNPWVILPGLTPCDTITFEGHRRWPWPVRFAAWLCRVALPPRPTPPTRQFMVAWSDAADFPKS